MAYGSVYELPDRLGRFDVVTLGSILLHLRDPFLALQKAASLASSTLVVTDKVLPSREQAFAQLSNGRVVKFLPDAQTAEPWETWWWPSMDFVSEVLQILGFNDVTTSTHKQRYKGQELDLFTAVGRRVPGKTPANRGAPGADGLSDAVYDEILRAIPGRQVLRHLLSRIQRRVIGSETSSR